MSIDTKHHHPIFIIPRHLATSACSFDEILADFKLLENLAATVDLEISNTEIEEKLVRPDYKKYMQLHDYRRLKSQESNVGNKFRKLNRSYSLQEMKENGVELEPSSRRDSLQQKLNYTILSEFIL